MLLFFLTSSSSFSSSLWRARTLQHLSAAERLTEHPLYAPFSSIPSVSYSHPLHALVRFEPTEDVGTSSAPFFLFPPETWIYGFTRSGFTGGGFCSWWVYFRTIWAPCWTARRPAAALKQRSIAISPTTTGFSLYSPSKTRGAMEPTWT